MLSNNYKKNSDLDITMNSDISELEKTLLQVKSLRYQIYSKFLSEKLAFETKLRKLENANTNSLLLSNKENIARGTFNQIKASFNANATGSGMKKLITSEKSIQTCEAYQGSGAFGSVVSSKASLENTYENPFDSDRYDKSYLRDEKLFSILDQLDYLSISSNLCK